MRHHRLEPILIYLIAALTTGAVRADPIADIVCVPPVVASPARCTFDIFGYVTDADGIPLDGAWISDGFRNAVTDSQGFYDLWQLQPGATTTIAVWHPRVQACHRSYSVNRQVHNSFLNGGTRQDAELPCHTQGGN